MAWSISTALTEALRVGGAFRPVLQILDEVGQPGAELAVMSGSVEVSGGSGPRRRLSCEVEPSGDLWAALSPRGVRIAAWWEVPALKAERVPLGVFEVDTQSISHAPDGGIKITAPDLWQTVARARFRTPRTLPPGNAVSEAMRLIEDVTGVAPTVVGEPTAEARGHTWPRDRTQAILELVKSAGYEVGFDVLGKAVATPVPVINGRGVFTVDAGTEKGVLLAAERSRSRQAARSAVVVTPTYTDGRALYDPVVVTDDDPTSPTYVGGPFGFVPAFYDTELIDNRDTAEVAGRGILQRLRGLGSTLDVTSAPNPALDGGDTIAVRTQYRGGAGGGSERHLLDRTTISLTPDAAGQRIGVRALGPGDVDGVT